MEKWEKLPWKIGKSYLGKVGRVGKVTLEKWEKLPWKSGIITLEKLPLKSGKSYLGKVG